MALQDTDLFVVQSADDSKLYKLRLDALKVELEAGAGVNFRGSADLNNPPASSGITLPVPNGDLYMVESDAAAIDGGWTIQDNPTSATKGDRIIYDGDDSSWILVTSGSSNAGTVTDITTTLPLQSDGNTVNPTLSIRTATDTLSGAVTRLATNDDVKHTDGTGANDAVVTANLLKATNDIVQGIVANAGGVVTVTYANSDNNNAILIPDTSGAVTLDIKNATQTVHGVVTIADASDITAGTAGGGAVVDASQLKAAIDAIPPAGVNSITESTDTGIVTGALEIITDVDRDTTIGVKEEVFCPFDFSALTDINNV